MGSKDTTRKTLNDKCVYGKQAKLTEPPKMVTANLKEFGPKAPPKKGSL